MILAIDLMIGDIVKTNSSLWNDEDLKDKYCKVEFIGGDNLRCVLLDNPERHPYGSEKAFDPIPITPEILGKNGFIKRMSYSDYRWYLDGYDVVTLNIYSESKKIWRMSIDTNRNENTIVYVTFVHQLQNALRLCGIEKEIEL